MKQLGNVKVRQYISKPMPDFFLSVFNVVFYEGMHGHNIDFKL